MLYCCSAGSRQRLHRPVTTPHPLNASSSSGEQPPKKAGKKRQNGCVCRHVYGVACGVRVRQRVHNLKVLRLAHSYAKHDEQVILVLLVSVGRRLRAGAKKRRIALAGKKQKNSDVLIHDCTCTRMHGVATCANTY